MYSMCNSHIKWGPNQTSNSAALITQLLSTVTSDIRFTIPIHLLKKWVYFRERVTEWGVLLSWQHWSVQICWGLQDTVPGKEFSGHQAFLSSLYALPVFHLMWNACQVKSEAIDSSCFAPRWFKSCFKFACYLNHPFIFWLLIKFCKMIIVEVQSHRIHWKTLKLDFWKKQEYPGGNEALLIWTQRFHLMWIKHFATV